MKDTTVYADLDLTFTPHPLTGDIVSVKNIEAIRRAVKHAVSLEPFDIPFNHTRRSQVRSYLFDQANQLTEAAIMTEIQSVLRRMEPRIKLQSVDVSAFADGSGYDVKIVYTIKSLNSEEVVQFSLQRVR